MTGLPLIFAFWLAIVIMIVMISKLRIHPFISIMLVSLALGLVAGIPLVDHKLADGSVQHGLATSWAGSSPSPCSATRASLF